MLSGSDGSFTEVRSFSRPAVPSAREPSALVLENYPEDSSVVWSRGPGSRIYFPAVEVLEDFFNVCRQIVQRDQPLSVSPQQLDQFIDDTFVAYARRTRAVDYAKILQLLHVLYVFARRSPFQDVFGAGIDARDAVFLQQAQKNVFRVAPIVTPMFYIDYLPPEMQDGTYWDDSTPDWRDQLLQLRQFARTLTFQADVDI